MGPKLRYPHGTSVYDSRARNRKRTVGCDADMPDEYVVCFRSASMSMFAEPHTSVSTSYHCNITLSNVIVDTIKVHSSVIKQKIAKRHAICMTTCGGHGDWALLQGQSTHKE